MNRTKQSKKSDQNDSSKNLTTTEYQNTKHLFQFQS